MDRLKEGIRTHKPTLTFIGSLIPAYFILFSYYFYLANDHGGNSNHKGFEWLNDYFFGMKSLVSFHDDQMLIGRVLLVFFAIVFVLTIFNRIRQWYQFRASEEWKETGERLWTRAVTQMDGFLIMSAVITAMFYIAPWSGYSGGWINDRFHLYIFLILIPFFAVNLHRYINYAVAGIIIALSLWHLGYHVHTYRLLNRDIAKAISLEGMDVKDTILTSEPGEWRGLSDSLGFEPKYVEPFGHLECLLAVHKGIAYLDNYEAGTDHFPLRYKEKEDREEKYLADFAIIWRTEYGDVGGLEEEYDLIDSNDYNRLYRRKRTPPDPEMWDGGTVVSFDMQPEEGQTAPGHIPVYVDTTYTDGKYGWLTVSAREESQNKLGVAQPYTDSILGKEDAVFRVALPNGTYEVICYFSANIVGEEDRAEPLEVNLITNGEKQIQRLQIPVGNETIDRRYNITITDEHLTQVIYTHEKSRYQRWVWSGFTIRSTDGGPNFRFSGETEE